MPNYVFSIEGNVGSGKSYLIKNLMKTLNKIYSYNVVYLPEPVNEWEDLKDNDNKTLLELYYLDQKQYSFLAGL